VDQLGTEPTEARAFGDVVSDLGDKYPKEKMDEISTSFCFICLLHLANEKGLKLEVGGDNAAAGDAMDEFTSRDDKRVGELWGLKVSFFVHPAPLTKTHKYLRSIVMPTRLQRHSFGLGALGCIASL
jgi:hypothetical protein